MTGSRPARSQPEGRPTCVRIGPPSADGDDQEREEGGEGRRTHDDAVGTLADGAPVQRLFSTPMPANASLQPLESSFEPRNEDPVESRAGCGNPGSPMRLR